MRATALQLALPAYTMTDSKRPGLQSDLSRDINAITLQYYSKKESEYAYRSANSIREAAASVEIENPLPYL